MRQTLFYIPREIGGLELYGPTGVLLIAWAAISLVILAVLLRRQGFSADTQSYLPLLILVGAAIAFLLPALSKEHGVPIQGYGVMLLLAVSSGVALGVYRGKRRGLSADLIFSLSFWMFVAGVVGARAFYVIEYWEEQFHQDTLLETLKAVIRVTEGGLVVYGSLIGAGIALMLFLRKHRLPGLAMGDLVAPPMILGLAIGRLGCFLNGCCYGGQCELPWAVTFPIGSAPYVDQLRGGELPWLHGLRLNDDGAPIVLAVEPGSAAEKAGVRPGDRILRINGQETDSAHQAQLDLLRIKEEGSQIALDVAGQPGQKVWTLTAPLPRSKPVHPAQLYSAIDALLLCLFLLAYEPYQQRDGALLALLLTIHPISRYLLEIVRVDEEAVVAQLSISQTISVLLLIGVAGFWVYVWQRPRGTLLPWTTAATPAAG